jgi:predicted nuclease of restriction endonuclease-like RecB superfamily
MVVPRWLEPRDEPWLRELAAEAAAASNRRTREVDERLVEHIARVARPHGASRRLVEAVWTVERKRWKTRVDAPVAPSKIRRALFPLASKLPRNEAIAQAAAHLKIEATQVEPYLFADRVAARLLVAPDTEATTSELLQRYNLALVQSLLHRATDLRAVARAHLRRVVSYAKLLGLMLLFEEATDGATLLTLSGPLALFHDTIKYGHALARWVPTLMTTPGWSLSANVLLQGEKLRFDLDASAPLPRTHAMSKPHDSRIEARLDRDLRALASPWRVEREVAVLPVNQSDGARSLVFPDFALVCDHQSVLVEIVGYWTVDYLERKLALLDQIKRDLILCIDEKHLAQLDAVQRSDPRILTFDKRVDARTLVERCERFVAAI